MLRFLLLLLIAAPAAAETPRWALPVLDAGLAAYDHGDFLQARAGFTRLAAQGSAIAETMLGAMASRGEGARRDPATAAMWWLRAANRGYPPAQLALAEAFARGAGVGADPGTAYVWARLAAMHGDPATAARARGLASQLAIGFDAARVAKLEQRRLAWRPWARLD